MDMASSMGLKPPAEHPEQVTQALHHMEMKDKRQETLVRALLPYLNPSRQARLERAMQFSQLSRLATAAMRTAPAQETQPEEGDRHV